MGLFLYATAIIIFTGYYYYEAISPQEQQFLIPLLKNIDACCSRINWATMPKLESHSITKEIRNITPYQGTLCQTSYITVTEFRYPNQLK